MSDFPENMRLKEKAEEDMYFARRDRERIRALHEKESVELARGDAEEKDVKPMELQQDTPVQAGAKWYSPGTIARYLRKLTGKAG